MELYTSYFAKAKNFDTNKYALISIAGKAPDGWEFAQYKKLAPSWDIWKSWHDRMEKAGSSMYREEEEDLACDIYTDRFQKEILGKLNANMVIDEIRQIADGKIPVLFCYEVPGKFCHRHLVADWLMEGVEGLEVMEWAAANKVAEQKTEKTDLTSLDVQERPPNCCRDCMSLVCRDGKWLCSNPNRIYCIVKDGVMDMVKIYSEFDKNWMDSKCFTNITNNLVTRLQKASKLFDEYRTNKDETGYGLMSTEIQTPNSIGYCPCYSSTASGGNSC